MAWRGRFELQWLGDKPETLRRHSQHDMTWRVITRGLYWGQSLFLITTLTSSSSCGYRPSYLILVQYCICCYQSILMPLHSHWLMPQFKIMKRLKWHQQANIFVLLSLSLPASLFCLLFSSFFSLFPYLYSFSLLSPVFLLLLSSALFLFHFPSSRSQNPRQFEQGSDERGGERENHRGSDLTHFRLSKSIWFIKYICWSFPPSLSTFNLSSLYTFLTPFFSLPPPSFPPSPPLPSGWESA